jgi:hypothetical protein
MPFGTFAPSRLKRLGSCMNSTTSMSSDRTSSTPATSAQVVSDLAPWLRFAGATRGIIPTVFQSSQTMMAMSTRNASPM